MASDAQTTQFQEDDNESPYNGLPSHYDVILCGTNLVNSILASALARAGYSILHCDGADYYGELDAVWTLPYLMERARERGTREEEKLDMEPLAAPSRAIERRESATLYVSPHGATRTLDLRALRSRTMPEDYPFEEGIRVVTPYGGGLVRSIVDCGNQAASVAIKLDKWSATLHLRVPEVSESDPDFTKRLSTYVFEKHGVLHGTCRVARALLLEHSRAFALDVTPGLIFCSGPAVQGLLNSGVSEYLEFKTVQGILFGKELQTVPCNKSEVFASKMLKAMEKRRLMWFLQLAMDYAISQELVEEVETIERSPSGGPDAAVVESLNERHLNQGRSLRRPQNKPVASEEMKALQRSIDSCVSFREYLKEQKLSDSLIELVRYAMALENGVDGESDFSLKDALHSLGRHLIALGRFGTTAFLATLYGSGELPQAFCRSAAVFGATYMLRTSVRNIRFADSTDSRITVTLDSKEDEQVRRFTCSNVVLPQLSLEDTACLTHRVWRRISIISGKPIPEGQQRHVIILPPKTVSSYPYVIQGLILDNGINVSPHAPVNSLLHLTTTSPLSAEAIDDVLKAAAEFILNAFPSESLIEEIFHVSFTYDFADATPEQAHGGLHWIPSSTPNLTVDSAFDRAHAIFESICQDIPFLTVADKVLRTIEERLGSAALNKPDDLEQSVLESAITMTKTDTVEAKDGETNETRNR